MADLIRAWAKFEVKSFDEEAGVLRGMASTPATDRVGDIVEPMGAQFELPMPFLYQHDANRPIGWVRAAKPTKDGIPVEVEIAKDVPVDFVQEAWALIRSKLVRGLSIGFKSLEDSEIKGTWGRRFSKWLWLELSAVTIPANAEATIQTIKSFDLSAAAASGTVRQPGESLVYPPPASRVSTSSRGTGMNIKETIGAFEAKRAANAAAMQAIMQKTVDESRTTEDTEAAEYDRLMGENARIDADLVRWRAMEKAAIDKAVDVPATPAATADGSLKLRAGEGVIRPNANLPAGIGLARYVKALAFAKGNVETAIGYAKQWDTSTPDVSLALKASIEAGTTTSGDWAGPLVYNQNLVSEFVDYLRPMTIIGKITGMRRVPFNVRYPTQTGGSTVGWVGEGAAKPVSKLAFSSGSLGFAKAAGIVVITQELARYSSPSAEMLVRDDLTAQMTQFLDTQFIDPGVVAVANVSPASILNGASNIRQAAAAWTSMANVLTDVKAFLSTFATNNIPLNGAYWIMTPDTALSLSLLLTTGGNDFAFPDINVNGGTWLGLPVIVSNSVPHSVSAGAIIALVKASEVFLADDGAVAIDVSQEASLQMDSAPTESSGAGSPVATTSVSMFQTNSIAIRAERVINWSRRRAYGVGYLDNVHTS